MLCSLGYVGRPLVGARASTCTVADLPCWVDVGWECWGIKKLGNDGDVSAKIK